MQSIFNYLKLSKRNKIFQAAKTLDNLLTPASWAAFPSLAGDGKASEQKCIRYFFSVLLFYKKFVGLSFSLSRVTWSVQ